ncbi:hypothetical protein K492DRAFT_175879 [Lichtheimia hyalospora FSU 10163]|nr:hypothetical protein K492DRAFT_175879 [Lichtheimia hyalospora FSU 10163]
MNDNDDDDDFQTLITPRLLSERKEKRRKKNTLSQSTLQKSPKSTTTKGVAGASKASPTYIKQEKQPVFEIEDLEDIVVKEEQRPVRTFEIDDFGNDSDQEQEHQQHLPSIEPVIARDDQTVVKQEATVFEIDDNILDWSDDHDENNTPYHKRRLISASDDDNDIQTNPHLPQRMNEPLEEDEECPLCFQRFPQSIIRDHASDCVGLLSSPENEPSLHKRRVDALNMSSIQQHRISQQSQLPPAYQPQKRSQRTSRRKEPRDNEQVTTANQEYRTCPICNDWVLINDLETHVNKELEDMDRQQQQQRQQPSSLSSNLRTNDPIPVSDTESDDSVIDISNEPTEINEDDGYLSPLEGFISVQERRDQDPEFERYFEQISTQTTAAPTPRRTSQQHNQPNRRTTRYRRFNRTQYFANKARRTRR